MKIRRLFLGLTAAVIMTQWTPVFAADKQIDILVDGNVLQTDVPPVIMNGRTMLPVAAVAEVVDCQVEWNGETREVTVIFPSQSGKMVMRIGSDEVQKTTEDGDTGEVTNETITIDAPPVIVSGRTLVPVAFIAETLGFGVELDGNTRTVYLNSALYEESFEPLSWNGFDFGPNLSYTEEYVIQSDPGQYLTAYEAAKFTFDNVRDNGNIPEYSDSTQYAMTLTDMTDIEGEPCNVYRLDAGEPAGTVGAAYAYAYQSGNIYMQGQGGLWVCVLSGYETRYTYSDVENGLLLSYPVAFASDGAEDGGAMSFMSLNDNSRLEYWVVSNDTGVNAETFAANKYGYETKVLAGGVVIAKGTEAAFHMTGDVEPSAAYWLVDRDFIAIAHIFCENDETAEMWFALLESGGISIERTADVQ